MNSSGGALHKKLCLAPFLIPAKETVDSLAASPSIRPRRKRGLLGDNGFSDLFGEVLDRPPRVAAFFSRRIEGHICLSTVSKAEIQRAAYAPPHMEVRPTLLRAQAFRGHDELGVGASSTGSSCCEKQSWCEPVAWSKTKPARLSARMTCAAVQDGRRLMCGRG